MNTLHNNTEDILNSLDGIKRASARPFMYTRVMAAMQGEDQSLWSRTVSFLARPAIAFCCMATIIATNVFFIIKSEENNAEQENVTVSTNSANDILQNDSYVLAVNNFQNNQ